MTMKYCVLVRTELAKHEYEYFETPRFFEKQEEAEAYAKMRFDAIADYPANVETGIYVALED